MMNLKKLMPTLKPRVKARGSALLISIVLSALMLTVGIMSARLAVRELELSADLFLSERAYFSAESGVERSLLKLKTEPTAHVQPSPTVIHPSLEDTYTEVSIRNLINTATDDFPNDEFSFTLNHLQSQRFRFQQDTDLGESTSPSIVRGPVQITQSGNRFFWRIICENSPDSNPLINKPFSSSLQGEATGNISDLTVENGRLDNGDAENYNNWAGVYKDKCFISVQNLDSSGPNTISFKGTTMAPHAATIRSVGTHQERSKIIEFEYAQSTLGSLFDFSFLHNEDGL